MTDRIHSALDGELPREALDAEERARVEALTQTIASAAAALRAAPAPDLTAAVLRGLEPAVPAARRPVAGGIAAALEWLWRPRDLALTLRPAYAFAGVAVVALALALAPGSGTEPPELAPVAAEVPTATRLYVQFRIEAEDASEVALAGSFTDWQPSYSLQEATPGVWSVMVPLEPGVHDYTFVIDGDRWVMDPAAPRVADSFGGSNSRLFLAAPADAA